MDTTRKLWLGPGTLLAATFAVLLLVGGEIYRKAPPLPDRVTTTDGTVIYTAADVQLGRQVWQSIGGWARAEGAATYAELPEERRAALRGRLETRLRENTYDESSGTITLDADRAAAITTVAAHFTSLFGSDPATAALREAYAMREDTVPDRSTAAR